MLPSPCCAHPPEVGPWATGPKNPGTPYSPSAGKFARPLCPSSTDLAPSQTDFSKIQIPAHAAHTSSNLERFTKRRAHGVRWGNLETLLSFLSSVQWV